MARSKFAGMSGTRPAGTGSYFTNGDFLARLDRIKFGETHVGKEFCTLEFTVLKTMSPGPAGEKHRPGEEASKFWFTKDIWFMGQFKSFAMVALGTTDPDEITDEVCDELANEEAQPLAGQLFHVRGRPKQTQSGKTITTVVFIKNVPHDEAAGLLGDDAAEILEKCYRDKTGFRSMDDFNARAAGE